MKSLLLPLVASAAQAAVLGERQIAASSAFPSFPGFGGATGASPFAGFGGASTGASPFAAFGGSGAGKAGKSGGASSLQALSGIIAAAAKKAADEKKNPDAQTSLPSLSTEPVKFSKFPGTIRAKVRYGPYTLPSTKAVNAQSLLGDSGMTDDVKINIQKPCTDCTILFMNAGLEYGNGTTANTDTGSWLHHIVMVNTGPGRTDAACGMPMDAFFTNGNERELKGFTALDGSFKSGYYVKPNDSFLLYSELMNMDPVDKHVWVTVYYEYLPGRQKDFQNTKAVWIQLGQCGQPDIDASTGKSVFYMGRPLNSKAFAETSHAWTAKKDGTLVFVSGHEHDGGTYTEIFKNDQLICNSTMQYGGTSAYRQKVNPEMGMKMPTEHISNVSRCFMMGDMKPGDTFKQTSHYNFELHPGMLNNKGELDEIMGISVMYVAFPESQYPAGT
jgi:hypothetical protein